MKKLPQLLPRPAALGLAVLLSLAATERGLAAETLTETKIRLMAETLRARDAGELDAARESAAQLRGVAPRDATVQRLQGEIERLIAARANGARNPSPVPVAALNNPGPARPRVAAAPVAEAAEAPRSIASIQPTPPDAALEAEADLLAKQEADRIVALVAEAKKARTRAQALAAAGRFDDALAALSGARAALPLNPLTQRIVTSLDEEAKAVEQRKSAAAALSPPPGMPASEEAAASTVEPVAVDALVAKGRGQYLAGDLEPARETFRRVVARDPDNPDAKGFLFRIAREKSAGRAQNRENTRAQLLDEVAQAWQRPGIHLERTDGTDHAVAAAPLVRKLNEIVLPSVSFTRTEIGQVVAALSAISEEFDASNGQPRGVNLVLLDPTNKTPTVTLTLKNSSLKRVLDFVTESIGYQYEVQADAVVLRPGGETSRLDTAFFPVTRATVLRMAGTGGERNSTTTKSDPLSSAGASNDPAGGGSSALAGERAAMRAFLQQAGVNFEAVAGSSLAYDGSALIVTHTPRNLERIRNILTRYNDVRQVEIEAKFIEVQEGALEELGVNWSVSQKATQHNGAKAAYATDGRSLAAAFGTSAINQRGRIVRPESETITTDGVSAFSSALDIPITNNAPAIPGTANLAAGAGALATVTGVIGEFDVNAVVRALSQQQGTDLLSAPKVTVLSGNPANITVAQEMRYPQSFGQTQSQVGTGSASGGGSAGVAITAGTPQEFTSRNVGVELKVTPTVEEDDYSISLDLNPRVTEFDGFVEYGGPSIAISGSTTVTVPSGFYQPIFSVRDISTRVTIWDGATLVMGGLTREEVKKVNDKVPILGDLPLIGRAFRSKGESAQKRNLLIFVTANLVNPGGSPKNQPLRGVPTGTLFRNPTVVTPAGAEPRAADGR